jgi:hypothetical protein
MYKETANGLEWESSLDEIRQLIFWYMPRTSSGKSTAIENFRVKITLAPATKIELDSNKSITFSSEKEEFEVAY